MVGKLDIAHPRDTNVHWSYQTFSLVKIKVEQILSPGWHYTEPWRRLSQFRVREFHPVTVTWCAWWSQLYGEVVQGSQSPLVITMLIVKLS